MLTRKAANEKREHALTFTFELAGCLNLARVRLVLRQSRQFCGNGCSCHPAPIIHWGVSCSDSAPCVAIGAWTDQEISRAIIHGVAPDGRMLKPPMTCAHYAGLKETDPADIFAHLRTVPALQ